MKKILVFLLACLSSTVLFAQDPYFTPVQPGDWAGDNMTINAVIVIDGVEQFNTDLELGVFETVNGECRGTKFPPRTLPNGRIYYSVNVEAVSGESFTYKLYDHANQQELEYEVVFTEDYPQLSYTPDAIGGLRTPYNVYFVSSSDGYTLTIEGYEDDANEGGFYLIASPVTVDPSTVGMTEGDFDLYYFDQSAEDGLEWRNWKHNAFNLEPGKGYLYAHKVGGDFILTGTAYDGEGMIELDYDENATDFAGWNLVGNPWGGKAYPDQAFYTMNEGGSGIDVTPNEAGTEVNPMTGIFVVANADVNTVTFNPENTGKKIARLNLNLTRSNSLVDRAIVRFGKGRQLPKFQLNPNHTKVFIPMEGKDYAIVNATEMGEMPVSFKAETDGNYTLSINAEEVSFAYLHLIDNMTGIDTDLLSNPSYSFEAKTTDYANRFKLVFATGNADDTFAFFSNGSFVINNEGIANVQVIDVTGRIVNNETINGCANVNVNAAPGVYMIRLVNGDNVKVQKVVVR